jgi:hypothetical protein
MPKETEEQRIKRELDRKLDEELENSFPASDALKIIRSRPEKYRAGLDQGVAGREKKG